VFNYLTFDNPITYLVLVCMNVLALASWPMTWVKVDYLGEDNMPRRAFFTAASMLERWRGGATRICALIANEK